MSKTVIPYCPITTAMWDGDAALGNLTRTWILFFQALSKLPLSIVSYDKATFGLAIGGDLVVGADVCPRYIVRFDGTLLDVAAMTKNPSTGGDVYLDIVRHQPVRGKTPASSSSIFGKDNPLIIPGGSAALVTGTDFDVADVAEDDWLTVDVTRIGSINPGGDVVVVLKMQLT